MSGACSCDSFNDAVKKLGCTVSDGWVIVDNKLNKMRMETVVT
jgi:hypothetical protein